MSKAPTAISDHSALNIVARCVLLDALTALRDHAPAVTVVGAQAVYLRSVEVAVAAFTSDADIGIDPHRLSDDPLLGEALEAAGFAKDDTGNPGAWLRPMTVDGMPVNVPVDLLVAQSFAKGNRGRAYHHTTSAPRDWSSGSRPLRSTRT